MKCISCNIRPARENGLLCLACKREADKAQKQVETEIANYETRRMGMTLEEYHAHHPFDCPRCHGNRALTFFCFWAEAGDYDFENKKWRI